MSETQIQTQAFSDQAVTDLDTGGVLTFSDVDVSQAVTTDGGLAFAPLPYTVNAQNYGAVSTAATAPYDELQWSGFTSKVEAPSASINLTFTYQVNASNGAYIDGLQQSLQMDANTGPGVTLAAVETVTDDSGNLVWQGTITGAAGETDVVLPYTYSSLNISVSVTEAVSAPIVSGQPIPKIGFSAIEQGFDLTTSANPAPGGPGPGNSPGTIIGTAFTDTNIDGVQENGESGIAGVTVTLLSGTTTIGTTTTDANGNYSFTNVAAGGYTVVFGTPGVDVATTATTDSVTVPSGGTVTENAGFYAPATITGTTFIDNNGNGTLGTGDTILSGVTVYLENASSTTVGTATTDSSGNYSFTGLEPGSYTVVFTTPSGDAASTPTSDTVTLPSGGSAVENAGYYAPASFTTTVYTDANGNGSQDGSETGLAGVTVNLESSSGAVEQTGTTDANGNVAFTGLTPGGYEVVVATPGGDAVTQQTNVATVNTLASGGTANAIEGVYMPATITGTTFVDNNDNGTLGTGDTDLGGVTVTLLSGTTTVATATTDASGDYSFTGLVPGSYTVAFATPGGDVATTPTSDAVILVSGGSTIENAGFNQPATFTTTVYTDTNGDGTQDGSETGLAGVTVNLENAGGTIEQTAITNSSGNVAFTGLVPGGYEVAVVAPSGDAVTQQTNVTTVNTLVSGGSANAIEGVYVPATITGTAFLDTNGDGTQNGNEAGIPGVTVTLLNASGNSVGTATTTGTGGYSFTGLAPGSYTVAFGTPSSDLATTPISDAVTLASGGSAIENAGFAVPASITGTTFIDNDDNGTLGTGDTDLSGVTVTLLSGTTTVGTETTGASGGYSFTGLAPGNYTVNFSTPGGDTATTAVSDTVPLPSGGAAVENAGYYAPATFTTTVYTDTNGDGSQDGSETGLAGVTVHLENAGGTIEQTAITNSSGNVTFTGLVPGGYEVAVVAPSGDAVTQQTDVATVNTLVSGGTANAIEGVYVPGTIAGTTVNNTTDTDLAGVTVTLLSGTTIVTSAVTNSNGGYSFGGLAPGVYTVDFSTPTGDTAATPVSDTATLTSGGTIIENAAYNTTVAAPTAAITGTTFIDNNTNGTLDAGDTDLGGVTVTLLSGTTTVGTTTTNSSGAYSFIGEKAGTYTVVFSTPTGDTATTAVSDTVTLAAGGLATENAGFYAPGTIIGTTFLDNNDNGTLDSGDTDLSGVTVTLKNASGTAVGTTTTNSSGGYSFTGEKPGTYTVVFSTPSGDMATTPVSDTATVTSGGTVTENAGFYAPAAITGTAFNDKNGDGTQDNGETGLSCVTVTLKNASGTVVGTTTTNSSGGYSFTGEKPGVYTVAFSTPSGDVATTPISDTVTLTAGGTITENAGFAAPASITGTTFIDNNDNGTLGCGDTDLSGVTVTLLSGTTTVGTTTTKSSGGYSFTGEKPGVYTVVFSTPTGDTATTAISDTVTLTAGGSVVENAGFVAPGTIIGTTFSDNNDNGTLDCGDTDLAGVTVTLKSGTTTVATTTTNSSGGYSFTGEKPGTYTVVFSTPSGDVATTSVSDTVTVTSGGTVTENAGFYAPAAITGTAFVDKNGDGTQDNGETGLSGVAVTLKNSCGTVVGTTTTNSSGGYSFTGEKPGVYTVVFSTPCGDTATTAISDTATLTAGGTITENAGFAVPVTITGTTFADNNDNGVLGTGDTDLAGVTVTLKSGTTTVATTTTNSSGGYSFTGEKPGTYTVVFSAPTGDTATTPLSDTVTLTSGGAVVENAGFYALAAITGTAFSDKNGCGTDGSGDTGLSGVTVTLKNASGTVVGTTTTNSSGGYSFTGEKPGVYTVAFSTPSGDLATTPVSDTVTLTAGGTITENAGFYASCGNNGTASISGEVWNDVNASGTLNCGESGLSGVTVDLLNSTGTTVLATTTTNSSGDYSFGKLGAGSYEIKVVAPGGDVFSPEASGSWGSSTSEVSPSNGESSVITLSACGSATVDAGVHPIISFASGCGTSGGGCGGGGCGSSESSNTNICGWDDGCEDNGGYGSGYGSCWTYDSGCGDYHNESGCSGQSASTAPITPFANISLSDTASVAVKITLTGLNGVTTDADGTLSGKGLTKTGVGTYTLASASAATMTAEMQALVFTPTANQVAPGQTVTTGFDVVATDANGYTDSDATTKVTVTATDSAPTLTQQTLSCTVAEGGTLQGLWSQILANAHDTDVGNQAKLTICSIGQSNTSGFLNYNASSGLLTYTGDDCNPGKTTDSFTYTIADPDGVTCTGTVDIAITGNTVPTTVSTSNNSTLTVSNSNGCFDSFGSNNKLTVSGSGNQVYGGAGANSFTVNGANNTIYTGSSNDTVSLGNTGNTVVLSLGGCDTVSGASLTNGTTFNLDTVLAQCDVQGATLSNISQYFAVACSGSNATLLYDGPGCGSGGSAVAVLNGIGSNTTLASLVSHNMLHV